MHHGKIPCVTVDVIAAVGREIVLVRRGSEPYAGYWALPGGFVEYGETTEHAARREMREETGLTVRINGIVGVYSAPQRDPRCHTIGVCYAAKKTGGRMKAGTDAAGVKLFGMGEIKNMHLAFDHTRMIRDYEKR